MSPCDDPLNCLAETTKASYPYKQGRGDRSVNNEFYGCQYDHKKDEFYDCIHNELYNHQTGKAKVWKWGEYGYWYTTYEDRSSPKENNYAVYYSAGEYEFYDDWYGDTMNTNGLMSSKRGGGKKKEFINSMYSA